MRTRLFDVMGQIDAFWEQEPSMPFEQLVGREFSWSDELQDQALAAATRITDGIWLYYLGNWCPEERETVQWRGRQFVATEDEPIGYQLMMAGLTLRYDGCRLASRFVSPARLAQLRSHLYHSHSHQEQKLHEIVLMWMELLYEQYHDQEDWFGQRLPASIDLLSAAFAASEPYRKQGNTSVVTAITVGRQAYFIKRPIEPGPLLTLLAEFQTECAITAMLKALPWKLGPFTGCLYVGDDGVLSYLSNKVPGLTMRDLRKAASRVSLASVQAAVFAEFIANTQDRHAENLFIDRFHAQPWLIDFAHSLDEEIVPLELPDARLPLETQRESFTRALWTWHPDRLQTEEGETIILEDVLSGILVARPALLEALAACAIPSSAQAAVAQRLDALERLAQGPGEKTLEQLNAILMG